MADLLSLSNASRLYAHRCFWWGSFFRYAILIVGLATSFVWVFPTNLVRASLIPAYELFFAIAAFVLQVGALVCVITGRKFHTLSRQGLQRTLLVDSFGETAERLDVAHQRERFGPNILRLAESAPTQQYFTSSKPCGLERLKENLQETAFFSTCLYRLAAWQQFATLLIPTFIILILLFTLPLFSGKTSFTIAHALIAGMVFFSLSDTISHLIASASASIEASNVDRRLEHVDLSRHESIMAIFADYYVITDAAPPIPEAVYAKNHQRLTVEWKHRRSS